MRFTLTIALSCILGVFASTSRADNVRRAQVAAATSDALDTLRRDVLAASVTRTITVQQFVDRTDSIDALARVLRQAEQIGGTRWLDEQTCQVRMELPGSKVADVIVEIAQAKPRETGVPGDAIRQQVDRLREITFAATGMSTSAVERLVPAPDQLAWRGIPSSAVHAAVNDARRNAARQMLARVEPPDAPVDKSPLGKIIGDKKVWDTLEGWLMDRPVTSVNFLDDLEVRVAVAIDGESMWDEMLAATGDRKDLSLPQDEQARSELRSRFLRSVDPTVVGSATAKAGAPMQHRDTVDIPREPPRWVGEQVDVRGSSRAIDGRLKSARAAESAARDQLRDRVEALHLSRKITLGEAARRDSRVRSAIDRAVDRARPNKVNYLGDGGAEVTFSFDLRDLWNEIERE